VKVNPAFVPIVLTPVPKATSVLAAVPAIVAELVLQVGQEIAGVVPPEETIGALPVTLVTVPPPPPPPARAEAKEEMMETVDVPPESVDMRMRTLVYPATLDCHVPVLVVDVAAVELLEGVAFSATQVVPPSPDASNCKVLELAFALTVNVTPPTPGSMLLMRHEVPLTLQLVAAALRTCFCWARASHGALKIIKIKNKRFMLSSFPPCYGMRVPFTAATRMCKLYCICAAVFEA
jgi:hypothetical protein